MTAITTPLLKEIDYSTNSGKLQVASSKSSEILAAQVAAAILEIPILTRADIQVLVKAKFEDRCKDSATTTLNGSELELTIVPNPILTLSALKHLFLCKNQLRIVPDGICDLSELETLHLHSNLLERLPRDIGKLMKLTNFSIHWNEALCSLPNSLGDIPGLKFFYIDKTGISRERYLEIIARCKAAAGKVNLNNAE